MRNWVLKKFQMNEKWINENKNQTIKFFMQS